MGKTNGFLEYPRKEPGYRPRAERLRDFKAVELRLTDEEVREQAVRCMDCGTPFCHGCGCPLFNVSPEPPWFPSEPHWRHLVPPPCS